MKTTPTLNGPAPVHCHDITAGHKKGQQAPVLTHDITASHRPVKAAVAAPKKPAKKGARG